MMLLKIVWTTNNLSSPSQLQSQGIKTGRLTSGVCSVPRCERQGKLGGSQKSSGNWSSQTWRACRSVRRCCSARSGPAVLPSCSYLQHTHTCQLLQSFWGVKHGPGFEPRPGASLLGGLRGGRSPCEYCSNQVIKHQDLTHENGESCTLL